MTRLPLSPLVSRFAQARRDRAGLSASIGAAVTLAVAVVMVALVGCTPAPEPTPTPTAAFASEEEAFAAAEAVYRAYNEAENEERAADSAINSRKYLTGQALEDQIEAARFYDDADLQLVGDVVVVSFQGDRAELASPSRIKARVCLDVSATRVQQIDGGDVTPAERPLRVLLLVTFIAGPTQLMISTSEMLDGQSC